ncbi:MAG: hypothetical protein FVQ83_14515 [Chloroflexi bacterium]|nr:hypothetical protein [Chloroflexota bacterium]
MQKTKIWLVILIPIILISWACGNFQETIQDAVEDVLQEAISEAFEEIGLPVPDAVDTIEISDGAVSFDTDLTIDALVLFFRNAASTEGFSERTDLTVITADSAYIVFEGHESDLAIVIEMEALSPGLTHVSMSLEML